MEQTSIQDDMTPKWHFVLPGQTYGGGRWQAGDVVELLPTQANGLIGHALSKGYATKDNAEKAAEPKAEKAKVADTSAKDKE